MVAQPGPDDLPDSLWTYGIRPPDDAWAAALFDGCGADAERSTVSSVDGRSAASNVDGRSAASNDGGRRSRDGECQSGNADEGECSSLNLRP